MNKTLIIISREYITRVKKRSFIIMTLLSPLLMSALFLIPTLLNMQDDTKVKNVMVTDESGIYIKALTNTEYIKYFTAQCSISEGKQKLTGGSIDAYIIIGNDLINNPNNITIYSDGQVSKDIIDHTSRALNNKLKTLKIESFNIEGLNEKLKEINKLRVNINTINLSPDGTETKTDFGFSIILSMVMAFLIYFFLLTYGTQVMRGIIEEKTNRIMEVIISSVKPKQLMLGKIIGVGLVAITQFVILIVVSAIYISIGVLLIEATTNNPSIVNDLNTIQETGAIDLGGIPQSETITSLLQGVNLPFIIFMFVIYFLGGYLIYASLFAAIGSSIDNETDTQQFVMPILMPLILSIWIAMAAFNNPHGDIAFWFSMIPFTSPIVMLARLPFDVPAWEIIVSILIMILSFVFLLWFAARVYRTGILMYGKKVGYKEIWKWFMQAGK